LSSCTERKTSAIAEAARELLAESGALAFDCCAESWGGGCVRLLLGLQAASSTSQEPAQPRHQIVCATRMMLR
jgi:hypothetical protein